MEKLRFKQDDGTDYPSWTKMKLGDGISVSEQVPLGENGKLLTVKLRTKGVESSTAQTLKKGATTFYQRRAGQLIYGKQNLFNGALAIVPSEFDGYGTSKDIPAFDVDEAVMDTCFLYQFLAREAYYSSLEKISVGTGSKRISEKVFLSIEEELPSLPEQEKIAAFLGLLDERVEAQRVLVKSLEEEKRGYMQAMLSPTPTLRFKQGDGTDYPEWSYRRLDSITSFRMGFTPSTGDSSLWEGPHEWLSIAGLGDRKYVESGNKRISDRAVSGKTPFPKGTLIMSFKLSIGKLGITRSAIYTNEAICGFENRDTFSVNYLYYALANTDVKSFGSRAVKGITLNSESLGGITLPFPSVPEQERIADFLSLLDQRLEVERDTLAALELEKKAFAQRVFF